MTKAMLIRRLVAVVLIVVLLVITAVVGRLFGGAAGQEFYTIVTDFIELEVVLIAVYLANIFQQRAFFVQGLRRLWSDIIEAKNEIVQYTHNPAPNQNAYGAAHQAISKAIDEMRGVYRNVGESQEERGRYPYEPLHDMRRALVRLGYTNPDEQERKIARVRVIRAWNALRFKFRLEFEPVEPTHSITERFARDPRQAADEHVQPPPNGDGGAGNVRA